MTICRYLEYFQSTGCPNHSEQLPGCLYKRPRFFYDFTLFYLMGGQALQLSVGSYPPYKSLLMGDQSQKHWSWPHSLANLQILDFAGSFLNGFTLIPFCFLALFVYNKQFFGNKQLFVCPTRPILLGNNITPCCYPNLSFVYPKVQGTPGGKHHKV